MKHYHDAHARNNERTHENILLTVWTIKNQLTSFRQSDKVMLYARTIVKNLPYPSVSNPHKAAYILAKQIINHFLASGLSTKYYRVGYEEDWKDKVTGNYDCAFIRELHKHPLNILHITHHELDDVTPDTRVNLFDCGLMVLKCTKSRQRIMSTSSSCLPELF